MAKVMIGVPMHKGEVCAQTMNSVFIAASKKHKMNFQLLGLSLLAKNFNLLFINAIRMGYDYFILHHSDLGIFGKISRANNESWLDTMIERSDQQKVSALSVVSPIKSPTGLTSSGLEMIAGDPWSLRRLTIKELERLPNTEITRDQVCKLFSADPSKAGALLVNTGILLMDIRNGGGVWREKKWPGFHIYDEIVWNTKGVPESFTIPEDWNMSSWCHENGVRFNCTKELLLTHVGGQNFNNHGAWGDETDGPRQQMNPREYELT